MKLKIKDWKGFTVLETILVIAIIIILSCIVILALNPGQRLNTELSFENSFLKMIRM